MVWADWEEQLPPSAHQGREGTGTVLWGEVFLMIYYFTEDRGLSSKCSSSTMNCKALHSRFFFEFLFPWGSGRANPLQLPLPRSS